MRSLPASLVCLLACLGGCAPAPSNQGAVGDLGGPAVPGGVGVMGPHSLPVQVDPKLAWAGFAEGGSEPTTVRLSDFQDPDGSKGIRVLVVTEVSFFCTGCYTETKDLSDQLAGPWSGLGVHVVQLVIDDTKGDIGQSTVDSAASWRNATGTTWAVAADPAFTFAVEGDNPLPQAVVIDPRTFHVIERFEGYQPDAVATAVTKLAHTNGAP